MYAVIFIAGFAVGAIVMLLICRRNKHLLENIQHELAQVKQDAITFKYKVLAFKNHLQKEMADLPEDAKGKARELLKKLEDVFEGEE